MVVLNQGLAIISSQRRVLSKCFHFAVCVSNNRLYASAKPGKLFRLRCSVYMFPGIIISDDDTNVSAHSR